MNSPDTPTHIRFLPFFAVALGVRFLILILGLLLIPVQPGKPVRVLGFGVAGFPADLRPEEPEPEALRIRILAGRGASVEPWYRWDATWFAYIAADGYAAHPIGVAFPPVMPAILAGADAIGLNPFLLGLLTANLAGAAGAAAFAKVAFRLTRDREVSVRAFTLLLAFPSSFFFSAPYHESFGLLFLSLALLAWLDARPIRAGAFALLASLARISSGAIGGAAFADWLTRDRSRSGLARMLVLLGGCLVGIAVHWVYVGQAVSDPLAAVKVQAHWGRRGFSPENLWFALLSITDPRVFWLDLLTTVGVAILGIRAWRRRGVFWGTLALLPLAPGLMSGSLLSASRLLLTSLPVFIELGDLLRKRTYFRVTVIAFAIGQLVLLNRYVHWMWAG